MTKMSMCDPGSRMRFLQHRIWQKKNRETEQNLLLGIRAYFDFSLNCDLNIPFHSFSRKKNSSFLLFYRIKVDLNFSSIVHDLYER